MRVFIDTNILISAILGGKTPSLALLKATYPPYTGLICQQNLDELRRIFNRKFPRRIPSMESFLAITMPSLTVVPIPPQQSPAEVSIRDEKDRPILRAALAASADILLTGDKDFLESGLKTPKIMSPAEFVELAI